MLSPWLFLPQLPRRAARHMDSSRSTGPSICQMDGGCGEERSPQMSTVVFSSTQAVWAESMTTAAWFWCYQHGCAGSGCWQHRNLAAFG